MVAAKGRKTTDLRDFATVPVSTTATSQRAACPGVCGRVRVGSPGAQGLAVAAPSGEAGEAGEVTTTLGAPWVHSSSVSINASGPDYRTRSQVGDPAVTKRALKGSVVNRRSPIARRTLLQPPSPR